MDINKLIAEIREYESKATYARMTNEKELPTLKIIVSDLDKFGFGEEDLDLKQRMGAVSEKILELEVEDITSEVLENLRREVNEVRDTLIRRYRDRMDSYATRQGNI